MLVNVLELGQEIFRDLLNRGQQGSPHECVRSRHKKSTKSETRTMHTGSQQVCA